MPPGEEVRGWARLLAAVADRVLAGTVQDMHRAVIDGTARWMGPIGPPIQKVHSVVTERVYGAVRASLRGAGELGVAAAGHLGTDALHPSPAAVKARAIAHGVVGAELLAVAPELDLELSVHHDGRAVPVDAAALRSAYPDARGRVAVFVHGLVDTEAAWYGQPQDGAVLPDVAAELGVTPVLVRYGTGRAVGGNGAELAQLLEQVLTAWPVPVTELTLVGHSMGGLLVRAACVTARERGHTWPAALTDVVYLGVPHLGSWLEKVANVVSWALRLSPHSAPVGTMLDGRSRGIKDLRFGTLAEDGWGETPIDDLLTGLVPDTPWLDGVTHHLIVGRLRPAPNHPLNLTFGDTFVRSASAAGAGRRRRIVGGGEVTVVPVEASHSRLVRHPEVAAQLRAVLGRGDDGRGHRRVLGTDAGSPR